MRRQFGWFAVGAVAVVLPAIAAADVRAGTPLATLRQAVTPARQPLPATLPVVTPAPGVVTQASAQVSQGPVLVPEAEFPPADVPLVEIPFTEPPPPLAPPVVRLPSALVEAKENAPPTPAVDLPKPADVRLETETAAPVLVDAVFAGPFFEGPFLAGPSMANPVMANPVLAGPFLAGPALSESPMAEPHGSQVVTADGTGPLVVAAEPTVIAAEPATPAVAPVAVPTTEPAKIERLPANVEGEGTAAIDDPTFRKPLDAIRVDVAPSEGLLPPNAAAEHYGAAEELVPRAEHDKLFFWQASNLCHRPLYFEQDYLERDGRSFGAVQPLVSGAQFFGSVPLLPLRMVRQPPCRCIYTLGESRPDGYGGRHR